MTDVIPPFAYGHDGASLVSSDGAELLVYDGPDEGPLWHRTAPATIVGVGITREAVVAVDEKGHLLACARRTGEVIREIETEIAPRGLCASRAGVVAVFDASRVVIIAADGATSTISIPGAAAAALDPEGKRLGVGTDEGDFRVFDVATGEPLGSARAAAPIKGACWNVRGFFLATTGEGVVKVMADGTELQSLFNVGRESAASPSLELGPVSCSEDGALCALRVGARKAAVFDLLDYQLQGAAHYERAVGQVDFGPGGWLGVGLDLGDANKIDVLSNAVCRTDPHPGRPRNTWLLLADFKTAQIQKVMDRAHHGATIAARRRPPRAAAPAPVAPVAPPSGGSAMIFAVVGLVLAAAVLLGLVLR